MVKSAFLRFCVVSGILAVTFGLLAMSGCGGGFGDLKPTIAAGAQGGHAVTVNAGQTATFTITASGTGPFTFQWYLNGVAISGANSSSYSTPPTTGSNNGGVYTVAVANAGGTAMSAPYVLTVNTLPNITVQPAGQAVVAGQPATFTVVATGTGPINYQWNLGGVAISGATSSSYTVPPTNVVNSGSVYTVTLTNVAGSVTSSGATLLVSPDPVALTFAPIAAQTYGTAPFTVSANSASIGAVTYSVISGPASINSSTGLLTITGSGTVKLGASQAASGNYAAATATTSFTVGQGSQTITFTNPGTQTYGATPTLTASASSGLAVSYSVTSKPSGIASVDSSGNMTFTGVGYVTVTASQAGNTDWAAATPVSQSFAVQGGTAQTISFTLPGTEPYGTPITLGATASSGLPVNYYKVTGPATVSGGILTFTGLGSVTVTAYQGGNTTYAPATPVPQTFTVVQGSQTITFANPGTQTYGASPNPLTLGATGGGSGNAVTYSVTTKPSGIASVSGNQLTFTGVGYVTVTANQSGNADYTAASAVQQSFAVQGGAAQTINFTLPGTEPYGTPITLGATASSGLPVNYYKVTGPATVSGGILTFTGLGSVTVTAYQGGNTTYAPATPVPQTFTVVQGSQTITFANPGTQTYGASPNPLTLGATGGGSGNAVTYSVTTKPSGIASVSGNQLTFTGVGYVTVTANQSGNADYTAASAVQQSFAVQGGAAQTINFTLPGTEPYGTPITLGATASSGLPVNYYKVTGPATVSGGILTFTGLGSVTVTAYQGGNTTYAPATPVSQTVTVNKATPTISVGSSANPSTYGGSVTFTATGLGPATGTVTFKDGATTLGTGTIGGGSAAYSLSTLTAGAHAITAVYGGDGNDNGATSGTLTQTVNQAPSTTSVICAPAPTTYGIWVTCTATVPGAATGTVQFKDGVSNLGSAAPVSGGTATYSSAALAVGSHSITGVYSGDGNFTGSTSSAFMETISKATPFIQMGSNTDGTQTYGISVTITAALPLGATGSVTFMEGTTTLGTGTPNPLSNATYTSSTLPVGSNQIIAVYGGDGNYNGATGGYLLEVNQAGSTTSVICAPAATTIGTSVTCTATVPATATGTVQFKDGVSNLGSKTVSGGTSTYTSAGFAAGSHSITGVYSGDSNFAGSTSSAFTENVYPVVSITPIAPANQTMAPGQQTFSATASGGQPTP